MGLNPNNLRKMQERMTKMQEDLGSETVEATSGGGAVKVVVSGHLKLMSVKIEPEAVDPDDLGMLEDLVLTAVNDGVQKAQDLAQKKMSSLLGGMRIPGLM